MTLTVSCKTVLFSFATGLIFVITYFMYKLCQIPVIFCMSSGLIVTLLTAIVI